MAGRPRTFDRDDALRTARDAFWRDGYDRTSVAGLTGAIGIAPPSLYAAFGDKDRLFAEASDLYVANFRRGVRDCLAQPTARAAATALLSAAARAHTDPATPAGCLVYAEPRLREEREWLRAQVVTRFLAAAEAGDLPAQADAEGLASFVDAVIAGMSARARDGAGRGELDAIAAAAVLAIPDAGAVDAIAEVADAPVRR